MPGKKPGINYSSLDETQAAGSGWWWCVRAGLALACLGKSETLSSLAPLVLVPELGWVSCGGGGTRRRRVSRQSGWRSNVMGPSGRGVAWAGDGTEPDGRARSSRSRIFCADLVLTEGEKATTCRTEPGRGLLPLPRVPCAVQDRSGCCCGWVWWSDGRHHAEAGRGTGTGFRCPPRSLLIGWPDRSVPDSSTHADARHLLMRLE